MRRLQWTSSCNTGATRDDGAVSQANQSECFAVGFAILFDADSKDEDHTVV